VISCYNKIVQEKSDRQDGGSLYMSTLEANLALLLTIPEERQEEIQSYLLTNFCTDNPYRPLRSDEILAELAESRACYLAGEGEDLDKVLDEIGDRYGL
jgi:hypothetical protein